MSSRRLAPQVSGSTDRDENVGHLRDARPDHYVIHGITGHAREEDGTYLFRASFEGQGPEDDDWVQLTDLYKNCRGTLRDYCEINDIDFNMVRRQAIDEGRADREAAREQLPKRGARSRSPTPGGKVTFSNKDTTTDDDGVRPDWEAARRRKEGLMGPGRPSKGELRARRLLLEDPDAEAKYTTHA